MLPGHTSPAETALDGCRLAGAVAITLTSAALVGCPATAALNAVPMVVGATAISQADARSPFDSGMREDELVAFDRRLRRAECGEAASQYWLATSMQRSAFDASPNNVEIYKWYLLAQAGGIEASEEMMTLEVAMTEADIAEARARARAWQPRAEDCVG